MRWIQSCYIFDASYFCSKSVINAAVDVPLVLSGTKVLYVFGNIVHYTLWPACMIRKISILSVLLHSRFCNLTSFNSFSSNFYLAWKIECRLSEVLWILTPHRRIIFNAGMVSEHNFGDVWNIRRIGSRRIFIITDEQRVKPEEKLLVL